MKWTKERSAKAHAAKKRLRIQRAESGLNEPELARVPRGEFIGVLQWTAADGQVRRWVIRQGDRANNLTVRALVAGDKSGLLHRTWTSVLGSLRSALCIPLRIIR